MANYSSNGYEGGGGGNISDIGGSQYQHLEHDGASWVPVSSLTLPSGEDITLSGDGIVTSGSGGFVVGGTSLTAALLTMAADGDVTLSGTGKVTSGSEGFIVGSSSMIATQLTMAAGGNVTMSGGELLITGDDVNQSPLVIEGVSANVEDLFQVNSNDATFSGGYFRVGPEGNNGRINVAYKAVKHAGQLIMENVMDSGANTFFGRRAEETAGAAAVVVDNSIILRLTAQGYGGTAYKDAARIEFRVDDPSPDDGDMGGEIGFSTCAAGATTLVEHATIDNTGLLTAQVGLKLKERAAVPAAPGATYGTFWVKNDTANTPWFTDDGPVDHQLAYVGAAPTAHTFGSHSDVTITGVDTGDVVYWSGSAWVNLGAGAATEVLTSNGASSAPSWESAGGGATSSTVFTQTTNAVAKNTTTETSMIGAGQGSIRLAANALTVGKTIRVHGMGTLYSKASPVGTLRIQFEIIEDAGGTPNVVTLQTYQQTPAQDISGTWEFTAMITCTATGGSGTVNAQSIMMVLDDDAGSAVYYWSQDGLGPDTIDTTETLDIDINATWTTADSDNWMESSNFVIEVLDV